MAPDHYAQCPVRNSTNWPANGPVFCLCYLIAKVEAEVRERIAQEIERYDAEMCVPACERCTCDAAARIARGQS